MNKKNNGETFYRITNIEIYKKLCKMHDDLIKQNGRIKTNRLISIGAIGLSMFTLGWLLTIIIGGG